MSLYLNFEPHSWYMGFAIRDNAATDRKDGNSWSHIQPKRWTGYTDNGNTYNVDTIDAYTLAELQWKIRDYHTQQGDGYGERILARGKR